MSEAAAAVPTPIPAAPAVSEAAPVETNAPEGKQPAPEPKPAPKTYKLKTAKGEREVSEDELVALASVNAAEKDHLEVTQAEAKRAKDFMRRLKENPREALSDPSVGLDTKKLAVDWLKAAMEEERLTPEQKQIRELQQKLKAREDAESEAKKQTETKKQQAFLEEQRKHYVKVITDAMGATSLPKSGPAADRAAMRMAQLLSKQVAMGLELPPSALAKLVEREYEEEHSALYGGMDPKVLLKKFPKLADALRRAALEEAQVVKPAAPTTEEPRSQPKSKDGNKTIDFREAQRLIRENLKR